MPNEAFAIHVQWDKAGLSKFDRYLETHEGKALAKAIDKAAGKALRPLAGQIKASERTSGIHSRTGTLYRSIGVRKPRKRAGEVIAYNVGVDVKKARYANALIPGHRLVGHKPGKRDLGGSVRAFPFVDPPVNAEAAKYAQQLSSDVWASSIRPL